MDFSTWPRGDVINFFMLLATASSVLVAIMSVLVAMGFFRRKKQALKDLHEKARLLDKERIETANLQGRLSRVGPDEFLEKADELAKKGDYDALEKLAIDYTDLQSPAIGRAAEILCEQRILQSETLGAVANDDALRFAAIGLASNPGNKRLQELQKLAVERKQGIARGEPIEVLNWQGLSALELNRLSIALIEAGKYQLAEIAARRAVPLEVLDSGDKSANFANAIGLHGTCLKHIGDYESAESLYRQSIEIKRKELGEGHPHYAISLNNLATLLNKTGRNEEAEDLFEKAIAIESKALGEDHPDFAFNLINLAGLLTQTGQYDRAILLMRKALKIYRETLGEDHRDYATGLHNLAGLLEGIHRYDQAEPVYEKAIAIKRKTLGEEHPVYAISLHNLAVIFHRTGRKGQAIEMMQQALAIGLAALGADHPDTKSSAQWLATWQAEETRQEIALPPTALPASV